MPRLFMVSLALLVVSGCESQPERSIKAIIGATLRDGTEAAPLLDSVIVVDGSRIRAAGPRASIPIPQASQRVDGAGKTVTPAQKGEVIASGKPANLFVLTSDGQIELAMREGHWAPVPIATPPPHP